MIGNKICIAWLSLGLLMSGKKMTFFLCARYPGWLLRWWHFPTVVLFYKLGCVFTCYEQARVACTSCSVFHLTNWENFYQLSLNTDSGWDVVRNQNHCNESKSPGECLLLRFSGRWSPPETSRGSALLGLALLICRQSLEVSKEKFGIRFFSKTDWETVSELYQNVRKISERKLQVNKFFICSNRQGRCIHYLN